MSAEVASGLLKRAILAEEYAAARLEIAQPDVFDRVVADYQANPYAAWRPLTETPFTDIMTPKLPETVTDMVYA